jgi:predicted DsbA family dithiol-disulfide isomerase
MKIDLLLYALSLTCFGIGAHVFSHTAPYVEDWRRILVKRFIPFVYVLLLALPAHAADRLAATGLDVKELDQKGQQQLLQLLDKYSSPCGKAHSLYTSLTTDKACKRAPFAGRFLTFLVGLGLTPEEIAQHYEDRFVTPHIGRCKPGGPLRGDEKAPLTICEFSDFQCPHCKAAEPILKKLLDDYKGKVRLEFKNFPLSSHPDARNAAAAAVAAGYQGKFWPMHDRLFEHQDKMSAADLEHDARELKLDVQRWYADLPAAGTQVDSERAEGLALQIDHTPTIYIGDREYRGPLRYEFLKDWVDEALAR